MPSHLWTGIKWSSYIGTCKLALFLYFWYIHICKFKGVPLLQYVRRLDISMNNIVRVKVVKGLGNVADNLPDEFFLDLLLLESGAENEI